MKNAVIYIHGKYGTAKEAEYYTKFFNKADVIGFEYTSEYPWDFQKEFSNFIENDIHLPAVSLVVSGGHTNLYYINKIDNKVNPILKFHTPSSYGGWYLIKTTNKAEAEYENVKYNFNQEETGYRIIRTYYVPSSDMWMENDVKGLSLIHI